MCCMYIKNYAAPNNVPITRLASSFLRSYESAMLKSTTGCIRHTMLTAILFEGGIVFLKIALFEIMAHD